MKYQTDTHILTGKSKKCVYCGKSFRVKDNLATGLPAAGTADFSTPQKR